MTRAAIAMVAVIAAGCSIKRASDDLACESDFECDDGRFCSDEGFCVHATIYDAPIDAIVVDADPCPSRCDSCDPGFTTCTIVCDNPNECGSQVNCPFGFICIVQCTGNNSCGNGVDCSGAESCNVLCAGSGSCDDGIECGDGPCTVQCSGTNSCDQGIDCNNSCACGVTCAVSACADPTLGCDLACRVGQRDCSTAPAGCNTCPGVMPDAALPDAAPAPDAL